MTPIVSIVGKSGAGKTTLLEKLVAELKRRGRRVATVKHDVHGFNLDQPGKDSWRHAQAGADAVVISSPQKRALLQKVDHDSNLNEIGQLLDADYDIILTEGYKSGPAPKVEVHRKEVSAELLCSPQELVALATDEPLDLPVKQFDLEDVSSLADHLESIFIAHYEPERASLYVNGVAIPLSPFVQEWLTKTTLGMVSALRGVGQVHSLELKLRPKGRAA